MSATTTRLARSEATALAWELVALLSPVCERIEIAGSLRRQRESIGDIELVCIPRYGAASRDLFNKVVSDGVNVLDLECDRLFTLGTIGKRYDKHGRPRWGSGLKWATYRDVAVDLFPVIAPAQWGVDLLLRTGSAAFSRRFVTPVEKGGLCPRGYFFEGGALWRWPTLGDGSPAERVDTPEEEDVFRALGLRFVEPCDREVRA